MIPCFPFNKYKRNIFFIFGCWLQPKNLAFAQKIMGLPDSGGPQPPGSYAYEYI